MLRSFFLNIFLLLGTNLLFGQTIPPQAPNKIVDGKKEGEWVVWYDKEWKKTDIQDSVAYYRKINYVGSKPDGMVYDFYNSGVKQWEGKLLDDEPQDIAYGLCRFYHENGNVSTEVNFENGKREGIYKEYYDYKILAVLGAFINDEKSGIWTYFDENGIKIKEIDIEKSWEELTNKFISLNNKGFYEEAKPFALNALIAAKNEYGKNHENYIISLNNLAVLFENTLEYETALEYYDKILEILEKGERKNLDYYEFTNSMAYIHYLLGNTKTSDSLYLDQLNYFDEEFGKEHEEYGLALYILGITYETLWQYEKATHLFTEALKITEKTLGRVHERYGLISNKLGYIYMNLGQYEKATPFIMDAIENTKITLGKGHERYGLVTNNLGMILMSLGQYEKATSLFMEALENTMKTLGIGHERYGLITNNLGIIYMTLGQYEKATSLYMKALENTKETLGRYHERYGLINNNLGMVFMTLGEFEKATPLFMEALENTENTLGKYHERYGLIKNNLGMISMTLGQYGKATQLYMEALENTENTLGKYHERYGLINNNLGMISMTLGEYEKATQLLIKALENTIESLGKDHERYGGIISNLGMIHMTLGEHEKATPLFKEALENTEKALGKGHERYGLIITYIGVIYMTFGQYEEAMLLLKEALENTEKTLGKGHERFGLVTNNLGYLFMTLGEYEKAIPLLTEALENTEKTLGKGHERFGLISNNLGTIYMTLGQYEKATPLFMEGLENAEITLGKNHERFGLISSNLGIIYMSIGQYEKAMPLFIEALENTEKTLSKDHERFGLISSNLGMIYTTLGQYEKAIPLFIEALENTEKTLGKSHERFGLISSNLGMIYMSIGQYEEAMPLMMKAQENTEKTLGKSHERYGLISSNLGMIYMSIGQYEKAMPLLMEAQENTEKTLGKSHERHGLISNNIGMIYMKLGQYEKATPLLLEALENTEKTLGKSHDKYRLISNNIGMIYMGKGQYEKAILLFIEVLENIRLSINQQFTYLDENSKENFLNTILYNFEIYHSFYTNYYKDYKRGSKTMYDIELIRKGLIINSTSNLNDYIKDSKDTVLIQQYNEIKTLKNILAKEYGKPIKEQRQDINDIEEKAEKIEGELTRKSNQFAKITEVGKIVWTEVKKALNPNEVAIEFASFSYYDKKWTDSIIYVALILRPQDSIPIMIPLFEEKELDVLFIQSEQRKEDYVRNLYQIQDRGSVPLDKEKGQKNLTELIWKPILPYLKEGCTIYYAPSGKLHRINLEAISIDKNQAMLDVYNMVSLQSTRQLIQQGTSNRILTNALLMGGISYSKNENFVSADTSNKNQSSENSSHTDQNRGFNYAAMDTIYNSKVSWKELTFTGKEVDNIATTLQKKNINYILKKEQEATEDNFKKICKATSPSIIHLSTHGYFFPDQNEKRSDLNIDEPIYKMSDHSLIRSGLILAGGNDAWQGYVDNTAEEDGILTSLEISNMDLSNTELVVLSACDTGLGDIKGSEGVFGLQRAFKSAGAKYLIMSLWQIPDKQTSKLMTLFYQKWLDDNMSIPDAFHAAQKQMKDDGFDPYQWAGFVLIQ